MRWFIYTLSLQTKKFIRGQVSHSIKDYTVYICVWLLGALVIFLFFVECLHKTCSYTLHNYVYFPYISYIFLSQWKVGQMGSDGNLTYATVYLLEMMKFLPHMPCPLVCTVTESDLILYDSDV